MKQLTLKALFVSAIAAASMTAQAASDYDKCIADGDALVKDARANGIESARALEQKTTVEACYAELAKIEAPYAEKSKGLNPSSVMSPADRGKWAKLFDAIDAKQFKGVAFLQAAYYR